MKKMNGTVRRSALLLAALFLAPRGIQPDVYIENYDAALKIARANNREAELKEKYSAGLVSIARKSVGPFLPSLDFSWTESAAVEPAVQDSKIKRIGAGITQKIYDGGKSALEYKMRKTDAELNFLAFKKEAEDFECALLSAYYTALLDRTRISVKKKALENARKILSLALIEFEQNMITEADFLETGISVKKIENELEALNEQARKSRLNLSDLMGVRMTEKIFFNEELSLLDGSGTQEIDFSDGQIKLLKQRAVQKSIELKRLNSEIDFARKERSLQKRLFLPSISFNGGVAFSGRNYPLTSPSWTMKVIVGFENNPWLPGKISGAWDYKHGRLSGQTNAAEFSGIVNTTFFDTLRQSKIELEQKCLGRDKLLVQIQNDVDAAVESIRRARSSIALGEETLRLMEKRLLFSEIRLREGLITNNDYIEEENEIAAQRIQNAENCAELLFIQKKLKIMTGESGGLYEEQH